MAPLRVRSRLPLKGRQSFRLPGCLVFFLGVLGLRVQALRLRVQALGLRVQGLQALGLQATTLVKTGDAIGF